MTKFLLYLLFSLTFVLPGAEMSPDARPDTPRGPQPANPYGVCAHLNRWEYPEMPREIRLMREIGIQFVRTDLDWRQVEKQPGEWDYTRWDAIVEQAAANGLEVLPILGGMQPAWGSPLAEHMDLWERYVRQTVTRYQDRIRYWEIVNEPDLGEFSGQGRAYGELLRKTCHWIKEIDPEAKVVMGGLAGVEYLEQVLETAGEDAFDIVNIHLYYWQTFPEAGLAQDLRKLKAILAAKQLSHKPVWLTETGYSTAPPPDFSGVVKTALETLDLNDPALPVVLIEDHSLLYYTEGVNLAPDICFREPRPCHRIPAAGIAKLDVRRYPILLLPASEAFPVAHLDGLFGFLKRGGTVIYPGGGIPFYFDLVRDKDGLPRRISAPADLHARLHIGWDAWWKPSGAPRSVHSTAPAAGVAMEPPFLRGANRFLTDENLQPGDRMIPLLTGRGDNGYEAVAAALYRFDSDLKGNLMALTYQDCTHRTTPEWQAKLLGRTLLIALAEGMERVSLYSFRSMEHAFPEGREGHFGLLRRDLEPKPAYRAYATLIERRPSGSGPVRLSRQGGIYIAVWQRPDGTPVSAVWSVYTPRRRTFHCEGQLRTACDHLGAPVTPRVSGRRLEIAVDTGIHYFENVVLQFE